MLIFETTLMSTKTGKIGDLGWKKILGIEATYPEQTSGVGGLVIHGQVNRRTW